MRNIMIAAAVAAGAVASPALANEARIESRAGIAWAQGDEEVVAGIAAGYDYDLGTKTFVGAEASADKVLDKGSDVLFGLSLRGGLKTSEAGKLYVLGGYTFTTADSDYDSIHAGAGYQHDLGNQLFAKVEYRRYFEGVDVNTAGVGIGYRF